MRLTDKNATRQGTTIGFPNAIACYWKLKKYEDIEEEIGIDLVILFKALKSKELWWKTKTYGLVKTTFQLEGLRPEISLIDRKLVISLCWHSLDDWERLEDYGKTWALTKEELQ